MKKVIKLTLLLAFLSYYYGYGQEKKFKQTKISGTFVYTKKQAADSIDIFIFPKNKYWNSPVDHFVKLDLENKFSFIFPSFSLISQYSLASVKNGRLRNLGLYYAQPGDEIQMTILNNKDSSYDGEKKDSISFTGKGSEKYNVVESLTKMYKQFSSNKSCWPPKNVNSIDRLEDYLNNLNQLTYRFTKEATAKVNNTIGIDSKIKKLLIYQYAQYVNLWAFYYKDVYELCKGNDVLQNIVKRKFNQEFYNMVEKVPDEISLLSPQYIAVMNSVIKYKQEINSPDGIIDFKVHYDLLKTSYSGNFREQIFAELFKGAYGTADLSNINSVYDSVLTDASKYMLSKDGHAIINEKLKFRKGAKLYDTDFVALNDENFNTTSLKGKVFILDVWGLGCSVCASFHRIFEHELWPVLKNKKDFVFLSVYDGKTKQGWKKGIDSQLYTSEGYLNVSNLPLGSTNHPFFKYYNINYAPFLLLVDKEGKILANFKPNIKLEELSLMINLALGDIQISK